jgi:hypothetical protein
MTTRLRPARDFLIALVYGGMLLAFIPLPALFALTARPPIASAFEEADRNRDGFIDAAEGAFVSGMRSAFALADANQDGRLDRAEFARAMGMLR